VGGEPELDYLCEGVAESVINSLSQLPRLRVVPRSTVFRYRARADEPQAVGRELGVRAVLAGRLQQMGELLVVKTELIDVAQEAQLWGAQYRRRPADIFALQEELAREISAQLRLKLSGEQQRRLARRATENTDAYHFYLKGRHYVTSKRTPDWIKKGIEHFQHAIDLDPNYALAYAGLSEAYAFLGSSTGERPPAECYPKAKAAAAVALELDDTLAEAHATLGFARLLYDWDFGGAAASFQRAIELKPDYANAHDGYGFYLKATGRHEEAIRECKSARALDPLSPFAEVSLGWAYYFARRYERAVQQGLRAREIEPRLSFAYWHTGLAYLQQGLTDEGVAALARAVELSDGGLPFKAHLGYARAVAGQHEAARAVLKELTGLAQHRYVPAYYFALIHLGLGEWDEMFARLEEACAERSGFLIFLNVEPMFDRVRRDPRHAALARRIGLTPQT
jgi:TolB-like protein/Flp pilus assembly protein TadD